MDVVGADISVGSFYGMGMHLGWSDSRIDGFGPNSIISPLYNTVAKISRMTYGHMSCIVDSFDEGGRFRKTKAA